MIRSVYGDFRPPVTPTRKSTGLTGWSGRVRGRLGSVLFALLFASVFVLILIQLVISVFTA